MIDIFGLASAAIQSVNPDIPAVWLRSTGYTTTDDYKQVPEYAAPESISIQLQPAPAKLRQELGLDMTEQAYTIYGAYPKMDGVNRISMRGGDVVKFASYRGDEVRAWKVVSMDESWPGWAKAVVVEVSDE